MEEVPVDKGDLGMVIYSVIRELHLGCTLGRRAYCCIGRQGRLTDTLRMFLPLPSKDAGRHL